MPPERQNEYQITPRINSDMPVNPMVPLSKDAEVILNAALAKYNR